VAVRDADAQQQVFDLSNEYFSIFSATPPPPPEIPEDPEDPPETLEPDPDLLEEVSQNFNKKGEGVKGDVNEDGVVDIFDLVQVGQGQ